MPSRTKPKSSPNPLHALRTVLSESDPISKRLLSERTGIAPDTIRAIESGRRKLTETLLRKISLATGGTWNEELSEWVVGSSNHQTPVPLTYDLAEEYHR